MLKGLLTPLKLVFIWAVCFPCLLTAQDYILGPDDFLNVKVYREEELDREVRIASDGTISFPLLGTVKVAGLTVPEFEAELTKGLKKYLKNPHVTVFIDEYTTISVTGQVKHPGSYPLRGNLTVIEAIGLAGGFTKIAAQNNVRILRNHEGKKKTIKVKVKSISKKGDKSLDIPIQRGDIIYVPESLF